MENLFSFFLTWEAKCLFLIARQENGLNLSRQEFLFLEFTSLFPLSLSLSLCLSLLPLQRQLATLRADYEDLQREYANLQRDR